MVGFKFAPIGQCAYPSVTPSLTPWGVHLICEDLCRVPEWSDVGILVAFCSSAALGRRTRRHPAGVIVMSILTRVILVPTACSVAGQKFGETTPTDSRRGLEHVKAQLVTREHVIKHGKPRFDDWLRTVLVATFCRVPTVKFS